MSDSWVSYIGSLASIGSFPIGLFTLGWVVSLRRILKNRAMDARVKIIIDSLKKIKAGKNELTDSQLTAANSLLEHLEDFYIRKGWRIDKDLQRLIERLRDKLAASATPIEIRELVISIECQLFETKRY